MGKKVQKVSEKNKWADRKGKERGIVIKATKGKKEKTRTKSAPGRGRPSVQATGRGGLERWEWRDLTC